MRRILLVVLAVLLVLLIVVPLGGYLWLHTSLPQTSGRTRLAGLDGQVEIVRDRSGVPHIFATTDHDELRRRQAAGLTFVESRELVSVLASLPSDRPVDYSSLPLHAQTVLDTAPTGAVEFDGDAVVRLCRPIVAIDGIIVSQLGRHSEGNLAVPFASVTRRGVLVDRAPAQRNDRADVGVVLLLPTGDLALHTPAGRRWVRGGWRSWRFSELVFREILKREVGRSATP